MFVRRKAVFKKENILIWILLLRQHQRCSIAYHLLRRKMAPGTCKSSSCNFFILLESNQLISDHLIRLLLVFAPNYSVSHLVRLKKKKKEEKGLAGLLSLFINKSKVSHSLTISPVIWISFFFSENRLVGMMTLKSLPSVDIYKPHRVEVKLWPCFQRLLSSAKVRSCAPGGPWVHSFITNE